MKRYFCSLALLILGSVMLQNFACTSPELQTAQMAFQKKDLKKTEENLDKELKSNPNSEGGLLLLSKLRLEQKDIPSATKALKKLEPKLAQQNKEFKNDFAMQNYRIWQTCYNLGSYYFGQYNNTKDLVYLDSALAVYNAGSEIRPQIFDFYAAKATILERKGDTTGSLNTLIACTQAMANEYDHLVKNNVTIKMTNKECAEKFGTPVKSKTDSLGGGAFQQVDKYLVDGKDVFIFYYKEKPKSKEPKDETKMLFAGLRYDPPKTWLEEERSIFTNFDIDPYSRLAEFYYARKDYDNAMLYLQKIQKIDPENTVINKSITAIYQLTGKTDVAIKTIEENMKKFPDNKTYYSLYADYKAKEGKYDEAIEYYGKSLKIDPEYPIALYNTASSYKNKALLVEKEEIALEEKNKDYVRRVAKYFPILKTSAEYFEKVTQTTEYKDDLGALAELVNIYQVVEDKDKLKETIERLESLEFSVPSDLKARYYGILLNVYGSVLKDEAKTLEIDAKIKELGK